MKIMLCGENKRFIHFLEKGIKQKTEKFKDIETCLKRTVIEKPDALFLLPDYDKNKTSIDEFPEDYIEIFAEILKNKTTKIYIENYPSFDSRDYYITSVNAIDYQTKSANYSLKVTGAYKGKLGFEILQKRDFKFFPNFVHFDEPYEILLEIKNLLGVHDVIAEDENMIGVGLIKNCNNVYTSMFDLTNYKEGFNLPFAHWKKLYTTLFEEITGADETDMANAFDLCYSKIQTQNDLTHKYNKEELKSALENAVTNAVEWHKDSGLLLKSKDSLVVYEMVRSFDLNIAKNVRGDSNFMTAVLFAVAGKYFENKEWEKVAETLMNEMLVNRDFQLKDGDNKGLFKWFAGVKGLGTRALYASDCARVGHCIATLYKITGKDEYKTSAIMCGEAFLKWFNKRPYLPVCFMADYEEASIIKMQESNEQSRAPEFYGAVLLALKSFYEITNDKRYIDQILLTAGEIAKRYPDYDSETSHSRNFTLSRVLSALSVAQCFEDGPWTDVIYETLKYFKELQHKDGGFSDGEAYFDKQSLSKTMEFAVGFGPEHGNICDFMYCHNTMLSNLCTLTKCSKGKVFESLAQDMFDDALRFALNTQIVSKDKRISGGWMRAYDMDLCEYYGCNKDFAWGAYSILAGWMMGTIPIVFLDMLGKESLY